MHIGRIKGVFKHTSILAHGNDISAITWYSIPKRLVKPTPIPGVAVLGSGSSVLVGLLNMALSCFNWGDYSLESTSRLCYLHRRAINSFNNNKLIGAIFLVFADVVARLVLRPIELPVGIMTALIGGPFFVYLVRWRVKR